MRRARFKVTDEDRRGFNGAQQATVIIEQEGGHALVRVRPFRRRREYVLSLATVAKMVIWKVVWAEAVEKRKSKKRRRRR
jgi:hypothetical protein